MSLLYCLSNYIGVVLLVVGIEYAYLMAPQAMQGVIMGMYWASAGIGDFIAVSLPYIFHGIDGIWDDTMYINCNRLDLYLFIVAGFLFISAIIFYIVVKCVDLGLNKVVTEKPTATASISTPQLMRRNLNTSSTSTSLRRVTASHNNLNR